MRARIFILGGEAAERDQSFDEILRRTFAGVLADNGALEYFTSLKDATVSIGKAFTDSDVVIFFSQPESFAETKEILCRALGLKLVVDEPLLGTALTTASPEMQESPYFNVCHAGVAEGSQIFALKDALYSGFGCKRGRQTLVLLPLSGERTRILLYSLVIPYLNGESGENISSTPLQFYYAQQLAASAVRENVKIAVASTKPAEILTKYLSYVPELTDRVMVAGKAEDRGNMPPNEYVVNLSITAAEFLGVPYGVAMSNAYYTGNDPAAEKTVYIAVTNEDETTVQELRSFYGESTGDFLFRSCGELCKLLARIIDVDAGEATDARSVAQKKSAARYKRAIAAVLALILLIGGGGAYYFYNYGYTAQDWLSRRRAFAQSLFNKEATSAADTSADAGTSDSAGSTAAPTENEAIRQYTVAD